MELSTRLYRSCNRQTSVAFFTAVAIVLALGAVANAELAADAEVLEPQSTADAKSAPEPYRIDTSQLDSPAWKAAINRLTSNPNVQRGASSVTLLRVVLEGQLREREVERQEAEGRTVNGVRLYIPHVAVAPAQSRRNTVNVQLSSTKLNTLDMYPSGGGMFQNAGHGDFILVEHINSTRRRGGRDPVRVRSFTHHHADVWVPVPPKGQVGILGDVVLKATKPADLGRIVADVRGTKGVRQLHVGTITVGGPYGRVYDFTTDGVGSTGMLAPGVYNVLLPGFNPQTSRWEVTVAPGKVTYLLFDAETPQQVRLVTREHVTFDDDSPFARPR